MRPEDDPLDSAERAADDSPAAGQASGTDDSPLDRFLPESLRTGRRRASRRDDADALRDAPDRPLEAPRELSEVGAHVDLVLRAAEQAAAQIRQEAHEAADEMRLEAGRDAARVRGEAEDALRTSEHARAEVEHYVRETSAAADAQAEQTLRDVEAEAARIRAEAARDAGRMVVEAEQRGEQLEDAARGRAQRLAKEAETIEGRLDELLATLRGLTDQLEQHLALDVSASDTGSEALDEALARPQTRSKEPRSDGPPRGSRARSR